MIVLPYFPKTDNNQNGGERNKSSVELRPFGKSVEWDRPLAVLCRRVMLDGYVASNQTNTRLHLT